MSLSESCGPNAGIFPLPCTITSRTAAAGYAWAPRISEYKLGPTIFVSGVTAWHITQ